MPADILVMQRYVGTKIIFAAPMLLGEYNERCGRNLSPEVTEPKAPGYFVRYADGYQSWSPAAAFEEAYRLCDDLPFGLAIEAAKKDGFKIARRGWNGKDMFVVYQKGYPEGIPCNKQTADAFGLNEGDLFKVRPYLQMRCADGSHQMWNASQSDILAEDWYLVG